jgi:NitT/TauT family transport system ATP-binding protein
MTEATVLNVRELRFSFQGQPLLSDVSLDVRPQEIVCLIGASGCGKSTLLRILAGLSEPEAGVIQFKGQPRQKKRPIGSVVFQSPALLPWLNIRDNISFGLDFASQPNTPRKQRQSKVRQVLDRVGLKSHADKRPAALSGGMAQRVALARAIVREPEIIFLDEPFSALDAITRESMQDLLIELVRQSGASAFLVTHDIDEALRIADRVLLLAPTGEGQTARIRGEWIPEGPSPRQHRSSLLNVMREDILNALSSPVSPWYPHL